MIFLESPEAVVGLYFGDVADIANDDFLSNAMVGTSFAATAGILGLTVESGDLVDRDRFILVGVRPLEAEPLTNALGRHRYGIEL